MRLSIHVADTGIGIPRDKIPLLFDPFFQVESGMSRSYGGTGLGLAISRQLAQAMKGDVRVRSLVGRGSVFSVHLLLPEGSQAPVISRTDPPVSPADLQRARVRTDLLPQYNAIRYR